MRSRHRLSKFLLRRGHRFPARRGRSRTSVARQAALRGSLSQATFVDYLCAVQGLVQRRRALIGVLEAAVPRAATPDGRAAALLPRDRHAHRRRAVRRSRRLHPVRESPRCCRGSSVWCRASTPLTISAPRARSPRPGPPHARRLLVEAAHHYRHQPRSVRASKHASPARIPVSLQIAWRCQRRLHDAGVTSRARAASAPGRSRSPAPASSPHSAGRPRPWTDHQPTSTRRPAAAGAPRATNRADTSPINGPANTGYGQPGFHWPGGARS